MGSSALVTDAKRRLREPAARALLALARTRALRAGAALCYHRVSDPQGRSGHELVPALGTRLFAAQLRFLRQAFRLVPASELPEAVATRRRGERVPLAITFDDDLACHESVALEILRAHAVPATFFVGGATLDGPHTFFWDALQAALDAGMAPDDPVLPRVENPRGTGGVHRVADAVRRLPRAERAALTERLVERAGGRQREPGLREDGLRRLVAAGFELGFHTRDHESLELLGDEPLDAALRDGRERLEDICRAPLRTVAYPYGRADTRVARAARAAGFEAGYTLAARPLRAGDDPLLLGRFQPSFASAGHTATELARGVARARA